MRWGIGKRTEEPNAAQDFELKKLSSEYPQAIRDLASLDVSELLKDQEKFKSKLQEKTDYISQYTRWGGTKYLPSSVYGLINGKGFYARAADNLKQIYSLASDQELRISALKGFLSIINTSDEVSGHNELQGKPYQEIISSGLDTTLNTNNQPAPETPTQSSSSPDWIKSQQADPAVEQTKPDWMKDHQAPSTQEIEDSKKADWIRTHLPENAGQPEQEQAPQDQTPAPEWMKDHKE